MDIHPFWDQHEWHSAEQSGRNPKEEIHLMITKDTLYLLNAHFTDGDETRYYCPTCAELIGLLEIYPKLKQHLDVRFVDFPRPRPELVELIGEENQSCPVLVLKEADTNPLVQKSANGACFVPDSDNIAKYLAAKYETGVPH